jgi:hypothetical protein
MRKGIDAFGPKFDWLSETVTQIIKDMDKLNKQSENVK